MKKSNKMNRLNQITIYTIIRFSVGMLYSLIFTVNMIYQVEVAKLSPLQLVLCGTALEVSILLFEIPTGVIADLKSRKLSVIIGYLLVGCAFILEGSIPFFSSIIIAQVLWGLGYTFTSGAVEAWISDEVGEEKSGAAFVKGNKAGQLGTLIAIPFSIMLGIIDVRYPIIIGGVLFIVLALFLIKNMKENGFKPVAEVDRESWSGMFSTLKESKKNISGKPIMILLLFIALFYGLYSEGFDRLGVAHMLEYYDQSIFKVVNSVIIFGGIRALISILNMFVMGRVEKKIDFNNHDLVFKILKVDTIMIVLLLLTFALSKNIIILLVAYLFIGICRNMVEPLYDTWFNSMIDNKQIRATMFSLRGQVDAIGQIGGGPIVGAIGSGISISIGLVTSALLLSPSIILFKITEQYKKHKNQDSLEV